MPVVHHGVAGMGGCHQTFIPSSSVEVYLGSGCPARSYTSQTPLHLRCHHVSSSYQNIFEIMYVTSGSRWLIISGSLLYPLFPLLEAEDSENPRGQWSPKMEKARVWITMWRKAIHQPAENKEDLIMQGGKVRQRTTCT